MNCEEISALIEEFYDDESDFRLKSRVKEHLANCAFCSRDFERALQLDRLLEKIPAPPTPSALLERKLMKAFERQHRKVSKSSPWWKLIFVGSLTIPKPAFAAALVVFAITVTAASFVGRYGVVSPSDVSAISPPASLPVVSAPSEPKIIENIKVVEVPVVKERIVTRIVYIERQGKEPFKPQKSLAAQNVTDGNKREQIVKENNYNLAMNGAVADGGYVTRANLTGFQLPSELKTRIIQEDKKNEK